MKLCVIWTMHQPNGWHPLRRLFSLPWTRIQTLRHYLPFLRLAGEFPGVPLTVGVSPDVLRRLEQATLKATRETMLDIHRKPAADLRPAEIADLVGVAFSATPEGIARPFKTWHSLWLRWQAHRGIDSRFIETLTEAELQDLQALVQLGWMDESLQSRVPELLRKARAGERFHPEEAARLVDLQLQAMLECLQSLRESCGAGEVEYLGAPLHRAAIPLLLGETAGYRYAEDARAQLVRGPRVHYLNFGKWPPLLYLPEGAFCAETAALLPQTCLYQAVASSRALAESLGRLPVDEELTACWKHHGREFVFTHAEIGGQMRFVYPRLRARDALSDLWSRVEAAANNCPDENATLTFEVDLAADGPGDAGERRAFWRGILARLSAGDKDAKGVRGAKLRDAIPAMPQRKLDAIQGGSRRARGFASWSVAAKPLYWKALQHAREQFQNVRAWKTLAPERLADAKVSLLVLESVEWMAAMEAGLDAFTQRKTEELFRAHLQCVYRSLELSRPPWLSEALLPCEVKLTSIGPSQDISPALDGMAASYHSWSGSGFFRERADTGCSRDTLRQLSGVYFGSDSVNAYLRVALPVPAREMLRDFELQGVLHASEGEQNVSWFRISQTADGEAHFDARLAVPVSARESKTARAVVGDVADLRLPLSGLGVRLGEVLRFQVSLWEEGNAVASAPTLGWEEFTVGDHLTYEDDSSWSGSSLDWNMAAS